MKCVISDECLLVCTYNVAGSLHIQIFMGIKFATTELLYFLVVGNRKIHI